MGTSGRRVIVGLLSAALLLPTSYAAVSAPSVAATPSATASTVSSAVTPTVRKAKKKKTKIRCVVVKKRVGKKIKKVKKCKKVAVKKSKKKAATPKLTSPVSMPVLAPPVTTPAPTPPGSTPGDVGPPSVSNTGVPAGMALTRYDGNLTITTPGTVIDGLDIHGYVTVKAANVTIKRSMIRGGPAPTVGRGILTMTHTGASNFLIEDVTIAPTYPNPYVNGINVNQSGTVRRANISGSVDGIMIYGSGVRVESSYLHTFAHFLNDPNWGGGPSHDDAIQVQAGTGIELIGNTLTGAYNTAVMVTQDAGVTKNLSIVGNWIDYGGCSVNFGSKGAFKTGMKVDNNRFGRAQRVSGCAIIHNAAMSDLVPTGNVWDDNGQPATIKRGG